MERNFKIVFIILAMFFITQFIGIYVLSNYSSVKVVDGEKINSSSLELPFGLEAKDLQTNSDFAQAFTSIIFAFIIAVSLILFLSRFKIESLMRFWFFTVVAIGLGISFNVPLSQLFPKYLSYTFIGFPLIWSFALLIGLCLSFIKIYKRNYIIHNLTEILIYPGIAAVFVPILNIYTMVLLLILISVYDMWAVWHSGIMQKMAKYQINKLNIFSGFFIPHFSRKDKDEMEKMRLQYKNASEKTKSKMKQKSIKVKVAVLGGGDIVFPIIAAGVMLKTLGIYSAIFVIIGAALGLTYLLLFSKKRKFYPAMPFISAGIFLGILISYLVRYLVL